jgi:site-specific DNA recombinase
MIESLFALFGYASLTLVLSLSPLLTTAPSAKRAGIYARISTSDKDGGTQSETSIEQQLRECRAYCAAQGWEVVEEYRDEGFSGTNTQRPEYQRMMSEMENWDVVIAAKMDRFHRNVRNAGEWAETLQRAEKDFVFRDLQIDTTTAMGMLIFRIMISVAQMEADIISERTASGLKGKKNAGRHVGRPPMGYRSAYKRSADEADGRGDPELKGVLELEPQEVESVRRVFAMHDDGMSRATIAKTLNAEGVSARNETSGWTASVVGNIVTKRLFYEGKYYDQDGNLHDFEWEGIL